MKPLALLLFALAVARPAVAAEITVASIVAEMNEYRSAEGLGPLFVDPRLVAAARERMDDMENSGYWGHEPSGGGSPFAVMARHGYEFSMAGENLANGFVTAEILVESWMLSPGHRVNVMSPNFTHVGIAIIDGHVGRRADGKSVIAMFAREMVKPVRKKK